MLKNLNINLIRHILISIKHQTCDILKFNAYCTYMKHVLYAQYVFIVVVTYKCVDIIRYDWFIMKCMYNINCEELGLQIKRFQGCAKIFHGNLEIEEGGFYPHGPLNKCSSCPRLDFYFFLKNFNFKSIPSQSSSNLLISVYRTPYKGGLHMYILCLQ